MSPTVISIFVLVVGIVFVIALFRKRDVLLLSPYPNGNIFAFSIIDDTDCQTLETCKPVYDFLMQMGLKTTKTVWVKQPTESPRDERDSGDTLERKDYLAYMKHLQEQGFEIALHGVSSRSNKRQEIADGIESFRGHFGHYPHINVSHEKNKENIYYEFFMNEYRMPSPFQTTIFRGLHAIYRSLRHGRPKASPDSKGEARRFLGDQEGGDYFWGDICKEKIRFHRSYVFSSCLNTLQGNPQMPYSLDETPYVNLWFDSSNGQDCRAFNSIMSPRNLQRLKRDGGTCILYTHFGKGFVNAEDGKYVLNEETKNKLEAVAQERDGWFAPVSTILERLDRMKQIRLVNLRGASVLRNDGRSAVPGVTLLGRPGKTYYDLEGNSLTTSEDGVLVVDVLQPGECKALVKKKATTSTRVYWKMRNEPRWLMDTKTMIAKVKIKFSS